jgi:hypothetical protein
LPGICHALLKGIACIQSINHTTAPNDDAYSEKEDVISMLEKIGEDALKETGFFHSGREPHINRIRRETYGYVYTLILQQTEY